MINLIIISILGIIISYQDFKNGKIRNKWIILGIIAGLIINYSYFLYDFLNHVFNITILYSFLLNSLITIFLGYLLWHFKFWSAGDGKLFIMFSFLLPLEFYKSFFPSFTIIFNSIVPIGIVLFLMSLNKNNFINSKKDLIKEFNLLNIIESLILIVGFYWGISQTLFFINEVLKYFFVALLVIFLKHKFNKIIYAGIVLVIIRTFFENILSFDFIIQTIIIFVIFHATRSIIIPLTNNQYVKKTKIEKLKPGMYLEKWSSSLNTEDIKELNKKNLKEVNVVETMPFAIYLFIGTLLTIILQTDLLSFLIKFFFS